MESEPLVVTSAARALAFAARRLEKSLGSDLTLPQYRVLALIAGGPERASRLADRASVSRPALTGILDGLEARGWVSRHDVSGDRRGVRLELTPAGAARLASADQDAAGAVDVALETLTDDEAGQVRGGLALLAQGLRRSWVEPAEPAAVTR